MVAIGPLAARSLAATSTFPLRSALKGGRSAYQNGVSQLYKYGNGTATPNWQDSSRGGVSGGVSQVGSSFNPSWRTTSDADGYSYLRNTLDSLSRPDPNVAYVNTSPSISRYPTAPSASLDTSHNPSVSSYHKESSQGTNRTITTSNDASSSWLSSPSSWLPWSRSPSSSPRTSQTDSAPVPAAPQVSMPSDVGLSSAYTWTTTPSSDKFIRSLSVDSRRSAPERKKDAIRGVLKSTSPPSDSAMVSAEWTTHPSQSLHVRSRIGAPTMSEDSRAWLRSLNSAWAETHPLTETKSTRLTFTSGGPDERLQARKWRAGRYLDSTIASRVEAKTIGEYQERILRGAVREARQARMDSEEAESYLLATMESLKEVTYLTKSEVSKKFRARADYKNTESAQSAYQSSIKSIHDDGKNGHFKPFLRYMRATESMIADRVVEVRTRDHDQGIKWDNKKQVRAALSKYLDQWEESDQSEDSQWSQGSESLSRSSGSESS